MFFDQLRAALDSRTFGETGMLWTFAEHEIDLRRQELRRAGEPLHVEPQVFDLLVHLIRHRDRIVSKDELFDVIWQGRIVSEAALSSRINAARKAIGDDGESQSLIRTIHKRGFRFIGDVQTVADDDSVSVGRSLDATESQGEGDAAPNPAAIIHGRATPSAQAGGRQPAIAVLPFANLSQEPDTEYFSYGLTEDIIRLLARNRWLKVLSRHSAFAYKSQGADAREIGAALGVHYLVQGSVWRRGERVRITTDLISAETGGHLWSVSYDLNLPDIFEVQASMAQHIAAVIEPELGSVERELAARKPPENLDAWECYQRGLWFLWGFTTPGLAEAAALFRRATQLDPGFARAFGGLSYVHLQQAVLSEPEERPKLLNAALSHARTAVSLDDRDCMCHCVLGRVQCMLHNYEEAIASLEKSIELNPSFAQGYFALGFTLIWCGREEEALALLERATELSPRDPHLSSFHMNRALAHFSLGDYEAAIAFARKAARLPNASHWPASTLAATLGLLGRTAEAQAALEDLLRRRPGYHCALARTDFFFCANTALVDRFVEGLRRTGLPDGPPASLAERPAPTASPPRR